MDPMQWYWRLGDKPVSSLQNGLLYLESVECEPVNTRTVLSVFFPTPKVCGTILTGIFSTIFIQCNL